MIDKSKIAAELHALAAQEGHDGEEWDLINEAGNYICELETSIADHKTALRDLLNDCINFGDGDGVMTVSILRRAKQVIDND